MKLLLHTTLTLLLILLCGLSCQKKNEDDPSLYVKSTGPGYFPELKATDARQSAIYRETESPREENRAIMAMNDERLQLVLSGFDPDRFTLETGLSPEWGESWTDED